MAAQLTLHQRYSLPNDVIDVERHLLIAGLVRERPDSPDYLTRPIAVVYDPFNRAARRGQVGIPVVEPAQTGLGVSYDARERLVYFMGDGSRKLPHRGNAIDVRELHLGIEQALFAGAQLVLRSLALRHVDDEDNSLVSLLFEKGSADQNRHAATILAEIFLLVRLAGPGLAELGYCILVGGGPLGGRQLRPSYPARDKVFMAVAQHVEKGFVGFEDSAPRIPDEDSDDVRIDQAADPGLPFPEIVVQAGILQRDRRLRRQQFQYRDPGRREHVRCQIVLE